MLTQILKQLRESGGIISLNELSRNIGIDRRALDGMLETLVQQGKLREIVLTGCSGCGGKSKSCHCGQDCSRNIGKTYQVV